MLTNVSSAGFCVSLVRVDAKEGRFAGTPLDESYNQQAARIAPTSINDGRSPRHRSNALGQRGLNGQPGGIESSLGIAPSICTSRDTSALKDGIAPINPMV